MTVKTYYHYSIHLITGEVIEARVDPSMDVDILKIFACPECADMLAIKTGGLENIFIPVKNILYISKKEEFEEPKVNAHDNLCT